MTIDEAIGELSKRGFEATTPEAIIFTTALKLSIEALKRLKTQRSGAPFYPNLLLPSETKD